MARLAFRFAMVSPRVLAEHVEAPSFPELAQKDGVRAVPHTVLNDKEKLIGAVPERALLDAVGKL